MTNALPPDAEEKQLGIAFFDLARFAAWSCERRDREVAVFLQRFYEGSAERLERAGARLVKFMGDAGLVVFEPDRMSGVVAAFRALRRWARDLGREEAFDTDLTVKVHVGSVWAGTFGAGASRAYDVLGQTVNETALLRGPGLVLSAEASRRLVGPERAGFEDDGGVLREA